MAGTTLGKAKRHTGHHVQADRPVREGQGAWKEAGCLSPSLCVISGECDNGEYAKWAKEMDETIEALYAAYDCEDDTASFLPTPEPDSSAEC